MIGDYSTWNKIRPQASGCKFRAAECKLQAAGQNILLLNSYINLKLEACNLRLGAIIILRVFSGESPNGGGIYRMFLIPSQ